MKIKGGDRGHRLGGGDRGLWAGPAGVTWCVSCCRRGT